MVEALGVDIGGVIIRGGNSNADTSFFGGNFIETPPVQGVFEALARLVLARFGRQVYLISKCGPATEEKSLLWLEHHRFFERTGIPSDHVRFCRERADKMPIARELGLTHFIDDRVSVLRYMIGIVPNLFVFDPLPKELEKFQRTSTGIMTLVSGWPQVPQAILGITY